MSDNTGIEWCDSTWNPVTGCTEVSPGCDHCYAKTFAERWRGTQGHYFERGFDVQLRPDKLDQPLRWRRPRRIFVNSMSDLFHDQVPDEYIARVWAVMACSYRHTFQVLTKRHARMRSLLSSERFVELFDVEFCKVPDWVDRYPDLDFARPEQVVHLADGPLSNVWLGVSTENQQWADIRIPALLDTPAAVRFISAEPLLGPIDLLEHFGSGPAVRGGVAALDWVIVGGESGPGARPMHPDWARSLRDQCEAAGVPFLFKQWGEWVPQFDVDGQPIDYPRIGRVTTEPPDGDRHSALLRVGKKHAGRELDGRTWDQYPAEAQS
ncbi:hypothetical protein A5761_15130 [Mycolicibacterium setense]|uniref:DUF5131 family protein n=1 Tax=Mycolicibacterium setense TaxID=431269 RepID=UPI0007E9AF45|nr:phage Gp37/Gp68 family protein [Mycolicibacterium setense]OBB15114.1 hypothetical protein A5761_15130 [Mycolicibacterium setense]